MKKKTPILLAAGPATSELEDICDANEARVVALPSHRKVLVTPLDGLHDLATALDDPELRGQIRDSAAELRRGDFEAFRP